MSAFAYTPHFDGVLFDGRALPGRNPIDGQFHSSGPGLYAVVDHDDELLDDTSVIPFGMHLLRQGEIPLGMPTGGALEETKKEARERFWAEDELGTEGVWIGWDGYIPAEDCAEPNEFESEDYWQEHDYYCDQLGLKWNASLEDITEAWAQERYDFAYERNLTVEDFSVYDDNEHLQTGQKGTRRILWLQLQKETCGDCDTRARQPYRKGRHPLNLDQIDIRRQRQNTDRQMNGKWLIEMTGEHDNPGRMTPEAFLDGFL